MPLERVPAARAAAAPSAAAAGGHEGRMHGTAAEKPKLPLAIRVSAVLDTGRRKVAYRLKEDGAFELVEIQVGPRAEGKDDAGASAAYFPVLQGLKEGDRVAVRGGYLLDSQQQISGMPSLLFPQGQSAANLHSGHGVAPAPSKPAEQHKH